MVDRISRCCFTRGSFWQGRAKEGKEEKSFLFLLGDFWLVSLVSGTVAFACSPEPSSNAMSEICTISSS